MEHQEQHEQDDDVYGGDVPEEAYMESDFDPSADAEGAAESKTKVGGWVGVCEEYKQGYRVYLLYIFEFKKYAYKGMRLILLVFQNSTGVGEYEEEVAGD